MGTEPIGGHPGTVTTGPLAGYRVLDLSQVVSGPFATMLLADQGADVIKVEPSHTLGDVTRLLSYAKGGLPAFYINNNRGKRAIAVDLQTDAGREIVLELAAESDVVVQNFRPGAIDRLGLGYADVCAVNPDVIYCSISGFGPDGPYSHRPVLDPVIQGLAGVISRQLNPEIPFPDLIRNLYADKSTALTVAQAITAGAAGARAHRRRPAHRGADDRRLSVLLLARRDDGQDAGRRRCESGLPAVQRVQPVRRVRRQVRVLRGQRSPAARAVRRARPARMEGRPALLQHAGHLRPIQFRGARGRCSPSGSPR